MRRWPRADRSSGRGADEIADMMALF